jgi:Reduced folate carrier.
MAYVQILWKTVDENITQYNGAIEAVYTLTSK